MLYNKKSQRIEIAVAGHICVDITPQFYVNRYTVSLAKVLAPGKLINVGPALFSTGGAVPNTGLALHLLGAKVRLIGKIGDDPISQVTMGLIKRFVDVSGIKTAYKTGGSYTIVISPPNIDRVFLHHPGPNNTFCLKDIDFELIRGARLFHFGYPPLLREFYKNDGADLIKLFKKVKTMGLTTSLDMSLPDPNSEAGKINWDKILKNLLHYIDIFLPSWEEINFMLNRRCKSKVTKAKSTKSPSPKRLTDIAQSLLNYGTKIVLIKCGSMGIYVKTADKNNLSKIITDSGQLANWSNRELWSPSYFVSNIISALGSGDAAISGFLIAFLKDYPIEVAIKCACAVGAQNLRAYDAISGIGSWSETIKMVENKKAPLNNFCISTPDWEFDKKFNLLVRL